MAKRDAKRASKERDEAKADRKSDAKPKRTKSGKKNEKRKPSKKRGQGKRENGEKGKSKTKAKCKDKLDEDRIAARRHDAPGQVASKPSLRGRSKPDGGFVRRRRRVDGKTKSMRADAPRSATIIPFNEETTMATTQQSNGFVADSIDRIQNYVSNVQTDIEKFQKDIEKRRKRFEKRAEKEMKRIQKDFEKRPAVKRANELQKNVAAQVEQGVDALLGGLQIASRRDVAKLDRKLNKINRKLNALDKSLSSPRGSTPAAK